MTKLKLLIELNYDAKSMHGEDEEAIDWFFSKVLFGKKALTLNSNEIGDDVGTIKIIKII